LKHASGVKSVSYGRVAVYLREHGELQIPSDQVQQVREKVLKKYVHLPEKEHKTLTMRVVSLPATTHMIADMMENYKETRRSLDALKLGFI